MNLKALNQYTLDEKDVLPEILYLYTFKLGHTQPKNAPLPKSLWGNYPHNLREFSILSCMYRETVHMLCFHLFPYKEKGKFIFVVIYFFLYSNHNKYNVHTLSFNSKVDVFSEHIIA